MRIVLEPGDKEWLTEILAEAFKRTDATPAAASDARSQDRWMTTEEAADLLRVSVGTLRHWRATGRAPSAVKRGRRVFYDRRAVKSFEGPAARP